MSTSLFNLDFLPTSNSESTISFKSLFDYKQQNSYLYLLKLESGSAFVNILDLTTTVGFAIGVHIILLIIYAILHKLNKLQCLKKIILKVIEIMSFGFYIGVFLETYLLFCLVEFSEIHYQNKNGIKNLKSTIMCYVILAFMMLFILLTLWQWCKAKTVEGLEKLKYFKLLVDDMKPKWICRAYWLLFLLRRTVFLAIIFFVDELEMIGKVILFVVIQTAYLAYIAILRPQAEFKENLIDFINEVFYIYFVGFLLYYNSEDRWNDTITDVYFWVMMSNNFILMFVLLLFGIKSLIMIVRDLCRKFKVKPKDKQLVSVQAINNSQNHFQNQISNEITQAKEESKEFKHNSKETLGLRSHDPLAAIYKGKHIETCKIDIKTDGADMILEDIDAEQA